jgi:hypothetical protein
MSEHVEAWSVIPMDDPIGYDHGPKRPRVLSWQEIRRQVSDFYGQLVAADFKFLVRDKDLHVLNYLSDPANTFINRYTVVKSIGDADRRLLATRRVIFRGPIRDVQPRENATHEFTVKDYLQERFGPEDWPNSGLTKVPSSAEDYVVNGDAPATGGPPPAEGDPDPAVHIGVRSGVGTFAADTIKFANHGTIYSVTKSSLDEPETFIEVNPALTDAVPDGTGIIQIPSHEVQPTGNQTIPVRGALRTDLRIIDGIDVGDGRGKSLYVGDDSHGGHTYAMFLWAPHGCYSPSGKPFQMLYFFNQSLDNLSGGTFYYDNVGMPMTIGNLATEAGSGGRVLMPGYANWGDCGFGSTSYHDYNGRRYTLYGLRGIFRDWALGVRGAPMNLGGVNHSVNAYGFDSNLDGTGSEVTDIHDQVVLAFNNFAWGDYQSGSPLPNPTFPDDATLTLLDLASFTRAKTHGATLVSGGFRGALHLGLNNERITMAEFWKRATLSMGVDNGWNRKTQLMVDRCAYETSIMDGAPLLTSEKDVLKGSFSIDEAQPELFTGLPFVHSKDELSRTTSGWYSDTASFNVPGPVPGIYQDDSVVIDEFSPSGTPILSQTLEFHWLEGMNRSTDASVMQQGSNTIAAILAYKLAMAKVRKITITTWGKGYSIELFDRIYLSHFANVGGLTPRPLRIVAHNALPDRWRVQLTGFDLKRVLAHPVVYPLTVVSGVGSGSVAEGVHAPIVAAPAPTGKVFSTWTGSFVTAPLLPSTTVTMPAAPLTVVANYVDTSVGTPTYTLTVVNGSGSGNYVAGATVSIVAATITGKTFNSWTGATVASATVPSTTLTMPASSTTVVATYDVDVVSAFRYVSVGGADYVTCSQAQSIGTPKRTLQNAVMCLSPGDTLYVRGGVYDEGLSTMPSGASWSSPIRVKAYPGETVWLRPSVHGVNNPGACIRFNGGNERYIEFDGINMDGRNVGYGTASFVIDSSGEPHHIRIKNAQIVARTTDNSAYSAFAAHGVEIHGGRPVMIGGFEFLTLVITGGGKPGTGDFSYNGYGIYLACGNNIVDGCDISDSKGAGIQIFNDDGGSPDNNIIRNTRIHDLTRNSGIGQMWGVIVIGSNTQLYNNILYNIGPDGSGSGSGMAALAIAQTGNKLWHNTIYNCTNSGVRLDGSAVSTVVINNIAYLCGTNFSDGGSTSPSLSNNLFASNPLFTNAGAGDFTLQSGSPARNGGLTITDVTVDIVGTTRPQGAAFDMGAYEQS